MRYLDFQDIDAYHQPGGRPPLIAVRIQSVEPEFPDGRRSEQESMPRTAVRPRWRNVHAG